MKWLHFPLPSPRPEPRPLIPQPSPQEPSPSPTPGRVLTIDQDPLGLEYRLMEIAESKRCLKFRLASAGETLPQKRYEAKVKSHGLYPQEKTDLANRFDWAVLQLEDFERRLLEA